MEDNKSLAPVMNLEQLVRLGMESEQAQGVALRAVQLGVSTMACSALQKMHSMAEESMSLMRALDERYNTLLAEELPTLTRVECSDEYDILMKRVLEVVKLEAKIAQGKSLFPEDTFSPEDRRLLALFSSLKTREEKDRFVAIIEREFGSENGFDAPAGSADSVDRVSYDEFSAVQPAEFVGEPDAAVPEESIRAAGVRKPKGKTVAAGQAVSVAVNPRQDAIEPKATDDPDGYLEPAPAGITLPEPPVIDGFDSSISGVAEPVSSTPASSGESDFDEFADL